MHFKLCPAFTILSSIANMVQLLELSMMKCRENATEIHILYSIRNHSGQFTKNQELDRFLITGRREKRHDNDLTEFLNLNLNP